MAIDFMVMPISRYISGDFVTPAMRFAWRQGVPYSIFGPDGKRDLPPGLPFGGASASARRARIVEKVLDGFRELPRGISGHLWDERSEVEPSFHRVDADSYQVLVAHFAARPSRSFLGWRAASKDKHCTASLILPCDFRDPVDVSSPFERLAGAAKHALAELARKKHPVDAAAAADTFSIALHDSIRLRLPLIVDW